MTYNAELELQEQFTTAAADGTPLNIVAGNTKQFLGRTPRGTPFDVSGHTGITGYEPKELVITARCGTPLSEINAALSERGQMLAFEPPGFGDKATLGGTIATGLSGSRRPYSGSARDFVLGTRILNGRGEILRFGGEVMKNVAGYDVSRLMTGAMGTLGVILEVSLKVLPLPAKEVTLVQTRSPARCDPYHERCGPPTHTAFRDLLRRRTPLCPALWSCHCRYLRGRNYRRRDNGA